MKNYSELNYLSPDEYEITVNDEINRLSRWSKPVNRLCRFSKFLYPSLSNLPIKMQEEIEENFRTTFIRSGGRPYTSKGQKSDIAKSYQLWEKTLFLQKEKEKQKLVK